MLAPRAQGLRILHVFRAPAGGLFRHVLDLAQAQIALGHEVGIVCDAAGGAFADERLAAIAPRCALGVDRFGMARLPGLSDILVSRRVARIARERRADILHGHGAKGGLYARAPALLSRAGGPARIYTPHGGSFHYGPGSPASRLYMDTERRLARLTDAVIFESAYVAGLFAAFIGPAPQPSKVVHNGLRRADFDSVPLVADPVDFLHLGEMRRLKGVDVLLEAAALIRDRSGREPSLALVGQGPDLAAFQALADRLKLARARFLPPSPAREAFALSRVLVVASRAESLPYVVMEAAAAGRDLIATQVGGIPEILGPFADRLIPPDDAPALAEAMTRALDEPAAEREARVAALRGSIGERMSVDAMTAQILDIYHQALLARAPSLRQSSVN